jgi:hypothetical protein
VLLQQQLAEGLDTTDNSTKYIRSDIKISMDDYTLTNTSVHDDEDNEQW